jgi:anaerobic selenocysteine-containing dehydrogenase
MRAQGLKLSRRAFLTAATGALGGLLLSRFWPAPGSGNTEPAPLAPERFVPTTCWIGKQDCGMLARVINGRVVKFEGHPAHPRNLGRLCPKGMAQIIALYDPNRVKTPLIRTNEKGVPGQFRAASWEEALTLVAEKIKEVRAKDPRLLLWQKGRSKAPAFYDEAFVKASGATKLHHSAFCSDAGYRACEYTIGFSGVLHPDFKHCRYLLAWGWNLTEAGGNLLCQITWPRQLLEAKEKNGLKVVLIDPRRRGGGPQIDEWLPIKPGTDLALALALAHVLVKRGYIDREYLTAHTNQPPDTPGVQPALIGSTIVLEGVRLPYRPVGAMAYHMAQQELGFQAIRAIVIVFMLLGAIEAVGGLRSSFDRKVHPNFHALDTITIKEPPYNIYLKESKYFPINSNNSSLVAKVMLDPHKYGVNDVPEVCIVHMTNPAVAYADSPVVWEAYKRLKFVVVIDPWLSKTADLFADVVLPAATIEKYEGPLNVTDQYVEALSVRVPPIEPLFDSRGEIEIYLDLCEKAGILYGEGGYLDHLNKALNLKDPYTLDLTKKPTVREIFDRWARSAGFAQGIEYFEKYGVSVKPIPVHKLYACAWDPPYGGIRHRLYGESLLRYREEMRAAGAEEIYWRDYTPLPTWRPPTMEESPPFYDLYLISAKKIEHKQSRSSQIPLLAELAPTQYVAINPKTARERGIADGDWVWVESHNAVTGETRRLKVQARFYEGIRPDTVAMPHHYGEVARHPWAKDQGPSPNYLFFTGEGYVGMTADQSFHVKVRIYKA